MKYLNTSTLAFALIIALAVLTSMRGKEPENRPTSAKTTGTEVVINDFSFSPRKFTVPVGATVTWVNHDSVPHVVTSTDHQFQKSPVLQAGQSFSNTFATAGTYSYFCSIHPRMKGEIIAR